jgi:hypothetical protein
MKTQTPHQLNKAVNHWINKATSHYRQQRWNMALPYAGCALETCWLLGKHEKDSFALVEKSLCLAIYCHNILAHQNETIKGEAILLNNWQWIIHTVGYENRPDFIKYCLTVCQNTNTHREIINTHTNWPFTNAEGLTQVSYH